MHPSVADILQYFSFDHLPDRLAKISAPFKAMAELLVHDEEFQLKGPELTVALRKLLEAKDCAVRAVLYEPQDINQN